MNTTPNPLIPQGTFLEQKGRSHIRIAVFTILAVHVVLLASLLMAGCKRTTDQAGAEMTNEGGAYPPPPVTQLPPADTSPPPPTAGVEVAANRLTPIPSLPTNPTPVEPQPVPPVPQQQPPPPALGSQGDHVVIKGESFYTIAKKYGVTSRAIQEANPGVDPARLKIGQKLAIPARTATALAASTNGGSATNGGKTYTVKSGDTLVAIAKKHGITVKDLQSANSLQTTRITVGQKLRIPGKTGDAVGSPGSGVVQ
jgi:LysM repeat protein